MQLRLVYLNSIEDNFYSKRTFDDCNNFEADLQLGFKFLAELDNISHLQSSNEINNLKIIAKIKFVLVTLSKLIMEFNGDNQMHADFADATKKFMDRLQKSSQWPQFYLIKFIVRLFGREALSNASKSKIFSWIMPNSLLINKSDKVNLIFPTNKIQYIIT